MKYRIGWPDKFSRANEITGPGEDGKRTHVLAIRWGCSCCRNDADTIDDLKPFERALAEAVCDFLNKNAGRIRRRAERRALRKA